VGAFHGNLPQVTRLMSCFPDTGLGSLWEVLMEGSHSLKNNNNLVNLIAPIIML
jgi:hypothetical protein